jgi:phosphatidyl-myo-inositol dimannoside synthase
VRGWARTIYRDYKPLRILNLLTDAFGGHGGIALYNRDVLAALSSLPNVAHVDAYPRIIHTDLGELPPKIEYRSHAARGKGRYLAALARTLLARGQYDVVLCSHINLLPLALLAKLRFRAPLVAFIYGIDAWEARSPVVGSLLPQVDRWISISEVTRAKFQSWSRTADERIAILPNAIHTEWYGVRPRNEALARRYGLEGRKVLMTLGRLVSSERYKGFDEVLEALPQLVADDPALVYVIAGDGSDRGRLEAKVRDLGLEEHVRFTGMIDEGEKADHFRLADAYVMPSRGEGFGFVFLEALACGVPVVASKADGGREALRNGQLGILVDPADPADVRRGIRVALQVTPGQVPDGLDVFHFDRFRSRLARMLREVGRHLPSVRVQPDAVETYPPPVVRPHAR